MSSTHLREDDEWLAHRVESWIETYKKSMLTPVILSVVRNLEPTTVAVLRRHIADQTGWELTERGLYRTVKRMQDEGLLNTSEVDAPRTGAKRKEISISPTGRLLLHEISQHTVAIGP